MTKLALHTKEFLQGNFELKNLNLLFVFQVNCPGCFLYGFPVVNRLYNDLLNKEVSILGLSTAFEDFEYNNFENTQMLLDEKNLVGETQKYLQQKGFEKYPENIDFPVAMDRRLENEEDLDKMATNLCVQNPNYQIWPVTEQKIFRTKVVNYLKGLEVISLTFTLNQMRGTPSFVLFNDSYEILDQWFGHKKPEEIQTLLTRHK